MDYDNLENETYEIIFKEFGELCYKNSFLENVLKRLWFHGSYDSEIRTQSNANILWNRFCNKWEFKDFGFAKVTKKYRYIFSSFFDPDYLNRLDDYRDKFRNKLTHDFAMISVFDTRWDENTKRNVLREKKSNWEESYNIALQSVNAFIDIALRILQRIEIDFETRGIFFNYY